MHGELTDCLSAAAECCDVHVTGKPNEAQELPAAFEGN